MRRDLIAMHSCSRAYTINFRALRISPTNRWVTKVSIWNLRRHTSITDWQTFSWVLLFFFIHNSAVFSLQRPLKVWQWVSGKRLGAWCQAVGTAETFPCCCHRGRQTGERQTRPDICWLRGDESPALSPRTAVAVCCCVAGRLFCENRLALCWVFFSLPLTKQSSLCKTWGPWRDQANSLQGPFKARVDKCIAE